MPVANPSSTNSFGNGRGLDIGVVIFAKAPVPGRTKTRLAQGLGEQRAAAIYKAMLGQALACVAAARPAGIELACAPNARHPFFGHLARRYPIRRQRQIAGDLGQRMAHALGQALRRYAKVVLIGSDQPDLGGTWLNRAAEALEDEAGAWLAPTTDGGYWAIGARRPIPGAFHGPRWSGPRVARRTEAALRADGCAVRRLAPRRDIDHSRDWWQLKPALRRTLARDAFMPGRAGACHETE